VSVLFVQLELEFDVGEFEQFSSNGNRLHMKAFETYAYIK
jgi:hypothetical protein